VNPTEDGVGRQHPSRQPPIPAGEESQVRAPDGPFGGIEDGIEESGEELVISAELSATEVRRRAVHGTALLGGREIALRSFGLVGNVVLARLLTPKDFGIIAFGLTFIGLASLFGDAGIGAALIRGKEEVRRADLESALGFCLGVCVVLWALITAAALTLGGSSAAVVCVMATSLLVVAFRGPGMILLERNLAYGSVALISVVESLAYFTCAIVMATVGAGVWSLATAVVVRGVAGTVATIVVVPGGLVRPRFDWSRVRRFMGFGAKFQAVGGVTLLRDHSLNLATTWVGGVSTLGLWSLCLSLLQVPFMLFNSLWRVSYPTMARLMAAGEDPGPSLQRGLNLVAVTTGLLVAGIVGSSPAFVPGVLGEQWRPALGVLPWSGAALVIGGPVAVVGVGYLFAKGEASLVLKSVLLEAAAWVAISTALIPVVGVAALGIGHLVGALIHVTILTKGLRRWTSIRLFGSLAPGLITTVLAVCAGWWVASALRPGALAAILAGLSVAGTYLGTLALFQRPRLSDGITLVRAAWRGGRGVAA